MTPEIDTDGRAAELLAGTPYLVEDNLQAESEFRRALRRSQKVRDAVNQYRKDMDKTLVARRRDLAAAQRERQVVESNRIEGLEWDITDAHKIVAESAKLLASPADAIMAAVAADPHAYQVIGLYKAYEVAEKWGQENRRPSEVEIRQLHHLITAGEEGAGSYRTRGGVVIKGSTVDDQEDLEPETTEEHARDLALSFLPRHAPAQHVPPEPIEVPHMMRDLVEWWQEADLDPVLTATVVHAWLAHIHPFHDGNGRLARLLASISLAQEGYPPLIVNSQSERNRYYDHLVESDSGNIYPLFDFFCTLVDRQAKLLRKPGYLDSVLSRTLFVDPDHRYSVWVENFREFLEEVRRIMTDRGWLFFKFDDPSQEQYSLLEDRDVAGNGWCAIARSEAGVEWLIWLGFRSESALRHIPERVHSPAIFFSPSARNPASKLRFLKRLKAASLVDGVPDECVIDIRTTSTCYVSHDRGWTTHSIQEAAAQAAQALCVAPLTGVQEETSGQPLGLSISEALEELQ